jgi:hypothetical protein
MPNSPSVCHPARSREGGGEGPAFQRLQPPQIVRPRNTPARRISILISTALPLLLVACASPGPPRPPSLQLSDIPTDLTAQRVGDSVVFHWTTPSRTTDGLNVPAPLTAEICRETAAVATSSNSSAKPTCTTVARVAVTPGPSSTADLLPAALTTDPATALTYRVRILNPEGRSAGLSKPVIAAGGAIPSPVIGLHATVTRDGALLQWQPAPDLSIIEFNRSLVSTTEPKPESTKGANPLAPPPEAPDIRIRTSDHASSPDPGGTLDRSARRGETYTYQAQRIRTVVFNGKPFELRSEPSPTITLALSDTFAPAVPTGLAAIPSGTATAPAIDLSWQANNESDLAGYNLYRRTSGAFQRVNSAPTLGPAFSDTTVTTGTTYTYRVTAVDNTGNESPPSTEITETARVAANP